MNEFDNFALVPKSPGTLEKAKPGAQRVLSGMVSDTLELVRNELATKATVSVAMCGFVDHWLSELLAILLPQNPPNQATSKLECFSWTTHLIDAARQSHYDLFILILFPGIYSCKEGVERRIHQELNWDDHGDEINPYKLVADLKREFNKPIFVISNELQYGLTLGTKAELEKAGADAIFGMPFTTGEFQSALQRCLNVPFRSQKSNETTAQPQKTRPPKIILVDDVDGILNMLEMAILGKFKNATVHKFQDSNEAWREILREAPDLLITRDKMPVLTGEDIVQRLVDRDVTYPIIVGGGWPPTEEWVRKYTAKYPNITYLRYPCTTEQLYNELSRHFGRGADLSQEIVNRLNLKATPVVADADTESWLEKGNSYFKSGNPTEALMWYRKAAERGNAKAQHWVGMCYLLGEGVALDEHEARNWFNKSARQGNSDTSCFLGEFYIESDHAEAYKWLTLAIGLGDERAASGLTTLRAWMSPQELLEGERRIREFHSDNN